MKAIRNTTASILIIFLLSGCTKENTLIGTWDLVESKSELKLCERLVLSNEIQVCDGARSSVSYYKQNDIWHVKRTDIVDAKYEIKVLGANSIALVTPKEELVEYVRVLQ